MKKTVLLVLAPIIMIIVSIIGLIVTANGTDKAIKQENSEYEYYLGKEIYGTEVASLMNKAINQNERNRIEKDEKGYYLENDENSLKVYLKMVTVDRTYAMEEINKNDMNRFMENFNLIIFKCTNIEYHKKTGKISKITIEQIEK